MIKSTSNNRQWPLEDNEQFAQQALERVKALLPEVVNDRDSLSCNLITAPANRDLLEKYFVYDEDENMFADDEDVSVFVPENMPREVSYVKIYYKNLEFVLFLDEYGINDEFTPRVHLQYLCNHKVHRDNTSCEGLCLLIVAEAIDILPDTDVEVGYSESEELNPTEDILDIRPFIDINVDVEDFAESPDNHLLAMLKILLPTVEKDVEDVAGDVTIQEPQTESMTKEEFEDKVLDEVVRFAKQHRDLSVNMGLVRSIVSDIINGCPADLPIIDYATQLLPELRNKADESEEMLKTFKSDMKHNIFLSYSQYLANMRSRLVPTNQIALKLGMDVNIYTNGIEYNSGRNTHGLHVNDSEGKIPLKHHISLLTRLFHRSELRQLMSAIEPFQKEFAEYVRTHQPAVLAAAGKYRDYTLYNYVAQYDCRYCIPDKYIVRERNVSPSVFLDINSMRSSYPLFKSTADVRRAVYEAIGITVS